MWAIGNEMETGGKADNPDLWATIEACAAAAKKADPNHPTMTVIAEIGGKVKAINQYCPSIDIIGINSYGSMPSLSGRYKSSGGVKPYIVTEFGPAGTWESGKNAWGAVPELTSTQKGKVYADGYKKTVMGDPAMCLGSYAFTWGNKQEATATWFGMLLPDGSRLESVDTLSQLWTGKPVARHCPRIDSLKADSKDQVDPGTEVTVTLRGSHPDGDKCTVKWVLAREAAQYNTGGGAEKAQATLNEAIIKADDAGAVVRMPATPGGYRLFVYIYDQHGGAATGNVVLCTKGAKTTAK